MVECISYSAVNLARTTYAHTIDWGAESVVQQTMNKHLYLKYKITDYHFFLFQLNARNMLHSYIYHQFPPTCFHVCYTIFRETITLVAQNCMLFAMLLQNVQYTICNIYIYTYFFKHCNSIVKFKKTGCILHIIATVQKAQSVWARNTMVSLKMV